MKSIGSHYIFALLAIPIFVCAADYQFAPIDLDAMDGAITSQTDVRQGSSNTIIISISGDAQITADNAETAQLHSETDTLVTEYKLRYVYHNVDQTTEYTGHDTFLLSPVNIRFIPGHSDISITLYVKASNNPDEVADSGTYTATQTLTVTWDGP